MKTLKDPIIARVDAARMQGALMSAWEVAWKEAGLAGSPKKHPFEVLETHYRPFVRARLFFEGIRPGKPRRRYFFAQLFPDLDQAEARLAQAEQHKVSRRTTGPAVFLVPSWCAVVWELPGGPKLRTVRSFMQRKAFRRTLERLGLDIDLDAKFSLPQLLRYVPRKRAVFRWPILETGDVLFIKLYEQGRNLVAVQNLNWLSQRSEALAFDTPEVRFHFARRRAVFMQGLDGEVLSSHFEGEAAGTLFEVGRALASLHSLEPELERAWSSRDELGALQRAMGDVKAALPAEESRITRLSDQLVAIEKGLGLGCAVPVHGNFFGDQVLVQPLGGAQPPRIGIVDWDDLALGDAEFDVGRLVAHMRFVHWQKGEPNCGRLEEALIAGYQDSGRGLDAKRLDWYVAVCLLMRAKITGLRKLAPRWEALTHGAIEECARIVASI